jgi:hypothetical protein
VPEHKWELRLRELAVDDVQIGAADTAGSHLEQDLTGPGRGRGRSTSCRGAPTPVKSIARIGVSVRVMVATCFAFTTATKLAGLSVFAGLSRRQAPTTTSQS